MSHISCKMPQLVVALFAPLAFIHCSLDEKKPITSLPGGDLSPLLPVTVQSQPEDLATDVSAGPVRLIVWGHSPPSVERERLAQLAEAVSAESRGSAVEVVAHVLPGPEPDVNGLIQGPNAVEILPLDGRWPNDWVTISIEAQQWGWSAPSLDHSPGHDGAEVLSWRFRPDSHPTFQRVEFCAGTDYTLVRFHFSEPPSHPLQLGKTGVAQHDSQCQPPPPEAGDSRRLSFMCFGLDWNLPSLIVLDPLLTSHSGRLYSVGTLDKPGFSAEVVLASLPRRSSTCVDLRLP